MMMIWAKKKPQHFREKNFGLSYLKNCASKLWENSYKNWKLLKNTIFHRKSSSYAVNKGEKKNGSIF